MSSAPDRTPFAGIDELPPEMAAMLIGALETMAGSPEIRRVRDVATSLLAAAPGQRLLDAGCGLGEVARGLAARVAPDGEVVALDFSEVTLAAARQRHDGSAVRYVSGDISALDLPDDHFDGVRSERVLQHVAEPQRAVAELVRVTRPGGRVCLIDTDWESIAVDGLPAELVAALRQHFFGQFVMHHRDMGRTLRRRLVAAGLTGVTAVPVPLTWTDPDAAGCVVPLFNRHIPRRATLLPDELFDSWFSCLAEVAGRDQFLATLTMWITVGTRPQS
jgi:SAM-dependent methyltransferase